MVEGEERRTCCTTVSLRVRNDSATVLVITSGQIRQSICLSRDLSNPIRR